MLWERPSVVNKQNGTAECVQALHILLSGGSIESSLFRFRGEAARNQRCRQERKQSHPVLRVSDGEATDRWKEEKVVGQGGRHGS